MLAVVLAQSSDVVISDVSPDLAAAAAVATGFWLLLLLAFALSTRSRAVEPAAPTMDLGAEPPALVDYLVNSCHTSDRAVAGTLLDLAARRVLTVEDREDDLVCGVGREPPTGLLPYEAMLYDHVADLARGGPVPAAALTTGSSKQSQSWHARFSGLVAKDASAHGFAESRWSAKTWAVERFAGFVAGLLVVAVALQAHAAELGILVVILVAAFAHQSLAKLFGDQRLTASGWAAASRWLGVKHFLQDQGEAFHDLPAGAVVLWDRYMAYACTFGLARTALRSLPLGAEDDHKAWSNFGGAWHEVHVSYPRNRWVWGRTPAGVALVGFVMMVLGMAAAYFALQLYDVGTGQPANDEFTKWFERVAVGFGAAGLSLAFWGLTTVNLAFVDFGKKRNVEGRVVRCRAFQRGNNGTDYFVAVDSGTSAAIKAWLVPGFLYANVTEGALVKATISPRQAHVYQMEVTAPGPSRPPTEETQPTPVLSGSDPLQLLFGLAGAATAAIPLLTADEVAGVLGEPVALATSNAGAGMTAATYKSTSGKTSVTLIGLGGKLASFTQMFANRGGQTRQIEGVPALLQGDSVTLMPQGKLVTIHIESGEDQPHEASLEALATILARRMTAQQATPA